MPPGLNNNSAELSDFAPAWVPEPNGRGLSANFQQGEELSKGSSLLELTSF